MTVKARGDRWVSARGWSIVGTSSQGSFAGGSKVRF